MSEYLRSETLQPTFMIFGGPPLYGSTQQGETNQRSRPDATFSTKNEFSFLKRNSMGKSNVLNVQLLIRRTLSFGSNRGRLQFR
jgi:hypothetical protein